MMLPGLAKINAEPNGMVDIISKTTNSDSVRKNEQRPFLMIIIILSVCVCVYLCVCVCIDASLML